MKSKKIIVKRYTSEEVAQGLPVVWAVKDSETYEIVARLNKGENELILTNPSENTQYAYGYCKQYGCCEDDTIKQCELREVEKCFRVVNGEIVETQQPEKPRL